MTHYDDQHTTVLPADGQPAREGSESAWAALVGVGIAGIAALIYVFRPHRLTFFVGTILLLITIALGALVAAMMALAAITPRTGPLASRTLAAPPAGSGGQGRRLSGWGKPQNWVKLVTVLAGLLLAASTVLTVVHKPVAAAHHHHHHHHHRVVHHDHHRHHHGGKHKPKQKRRHHG